MSVSPAANPLLGQNTLCIPFLPHRYENPEYHNRISGFLYTISSTLCWIDLLDRHSRDKGLSSNVVGYSFIARILFRQYSLGMNISHKRNFFDNIEGIDIRKLAAKAQQFIDANTRENKYFDLEKFKIEISDHIPADRIDRLMQLACRPHSNTSNGGGRSTNTSHQNVRRSTKKNMKSRR